MLVRSHGHGKQLFAYSLSNGTLIVVPGGRGECDAVYA